MTKANDICRRVWEARHAQRIAKRGLKRARLCGDREEQYHYWKMKRSTRLKLSRALDALNRHNRRHHA